MGGRKCSQGTTGLTFEQGTPANSMACSMSSETVLRSCINMLSKQLATWSLSRLLICRRKGEVFCFCQWLVCCELCSQHAASPSAMPAEVQVTSGVGSTAKRQCCKLPDRPRWLWNHYGLCQLQFHSWCCPADTLAGVAISKPPLASLPSTLAWEIVFCTRPKRPLCQHRRRRQQTH